MEKKIIHLEAIVKHYKVGPSVVRALRSVTIDIFKGEYVAVMGASGIWKVDANEYYWLPGYSHQRKVYPQRQGGKQHV
jgi:ABC-type microcin C transport system duplicated ATPase subunit YejF